MFWDELRRDPAIRAFVIVLAVTILVGLPLALLSNSFQPRSYGPSAMHSMYGSVTASGEGSMISGALLLGIRLLSLTLIVGLAGGLILWVKRQVDGESGWHRAETVGMTAAMKRSSSAEVASCPYCQETIQDDYRFCPSCKREIRPICRKCGKELQSGWRACPHCGKEASKERHSS